MADLQHLSLNDNLLNSTIPTTFGLLKDLTHLSMSNNALSGPIPKELGNCFRLVSLHLDGNELTGEIPTQLGKLDQVNSLKIEKNNFGNVTIPPQVCALVTEEDLRHFSSDCTNKITCECCHECH